MCISDFIKFAVIASMHVCIVHMQLIFLDNNSTVHSCKDRSRVPYRDYDALLLEPCPVDNEVSSHGNGVVHPAVP